MGIFQDLFGKKRNDENDENEDRHELQFNDDGTTGEHEEAQVFRVSASNPLANMSIQIDIETDRPVKITKFSLRSTNLSDGGIGYGNSPLSSALDAISKGEVPSDIPPEVIKALISSIVGEDPSGDLIKGIEQHGMPPLEFLEEALKPGGFLDNNPIAEYMYITAKEAPEWERDQAVTEYLEKIKKGPIPDDGCDCNACEAKRKAKGTPLMRPIDEEHEQEGEQDIKIDLNKAERSYRKEIDDLENLLNEDDQT